MYIYTYIYSIYICKIDRYTHLCGTHIFAVHTSTNAYPYEMHILMLWWRPLIPRSWNAKRAPFEKGSVHTFSQIYKCISFTNTDVTQFLSSFVFMAQQLARSRIESPERHKVIDSQQKIPGGHDIASVDLFFVFWSSIVESLQQNAAQHTATYCNTLQRTATHYNTLQCTAVQCCRTIQDTATKFCTLHNTATYCSTLYHTAAHGTALQHALQHVNTLPHTVPRRSTI